MLAIVTFLNSAGSSVYADESEAAIAAITRVGGNYERDLNADNKPVVKVTLARTKASDAAVKLIVALPKLESLDLEDTLITNASLKLLAQCKTLRTINIAGTRVANAAVQELTKARPEVTIVREASMESIRARAKSLEALGIEFEIGPDDETGELKVHFNYQTGDAEQVQAAGALDLKAIVARLPEITHVTLGNLGTSQACAAGLSHFARLPNLRSLSVRGRITDADLSKLLGPESLKELGVTATGALFLKNGLNRQPLQPLTDAAFVNLKSFKNLEKFFVGSLNTAGNGVTDRTAVALANCKKMKDIRLPTTHITDQGVASLASLVDLTYLDLQSNRGITDKSVEALSKLQKLETLILLNTGMTPQGLARLRATLPKTQISG